MRRLIADLNGDGLADIVGFGIAGVTVAQATGGGNIRPCKPTFGRVRHVKQRRRLVSDDPYPGGS